MRTSHQPTVTAMWGTVAVLLLILLTPATAPAAMWTSTPPGAWNCAQPGNGCVAHTGFDPRRSHWGQYPNALGNCTNYAAYRLSRNGASRLPFGDASTWAGVARRELGESRVNSRPAVGAIAWWGGAHPYFGSSGFGHVAYVEKVSSAGTVYLSDSIWNRSSNRWTVRRGSALWPQAFLHIKTKPDGQPPTGRLERVRGLTGNRIRVTGWAFDPDGPSRPVRVEAWIDGKQGQHGARKVSLGFATLARTDVARVHRKAGSRHGFNRLIRGVPPGVRVVRVYAINRFKGGDTKYLGGKTIRVPRPPAEPSDESDDSAGNESGTSNGSVWHLTNQLDGGRDIADFSYGRASDIPIAGDWNGDGKDSIGVFRPSDGRWYLTNQLDGGRDIADFSYGRAGDRAVAGSWNSTRDAVGLFRPSVSRWYLTNQFDGGRDIADFSYGRANDIPVAGDWNGDGKDTIGVRR